MNSGLAKKKAHNRGTRKGMRRKTARKAYMKVHKSRKSRKPQKSTRKGMSRKTARRAYMNKRGGISTTNRSSSQSAAHHRIKFANQYRIHNKYPMAKPPAIPKGLFYK